LVSRVFQIQPQVTRAKIGMTIKCTRHRPIQTLSNSGSNESKPCEVGWS
jgi:hypothetical protein